jgi:hypothetical protein
MERSILSITGIGLTCHIARQVHRPEMGRRAGAVGFS